MKKTSGTVITAQDLVLLTATSGFTEYTAAGAAEFPYFHLGMLVFGSLLMVQLKCKYHKMHISEAVDAFALYAVLMTLLTNPVIDLLKTIVT